MFMSLPRPLGAVKHVPDARVTCLSLGTPRHQFRPTEQRLPSLTASRSARPRLRPGVAAGSLLLGLVLGVPGVVAGQGLPAWGPINPAATSRSGLSFQPYVDPAPGRWRISLSAEYASAIEYNLPAAEP